MVSQPKGPELARPPCAAGLRDHQPKEGSLLSTCKSDLGRACADSNPGSRGEAKVSKALFLDLKTLRIVVDLAVPIASITVQSVVLVHRRCAAG